MIKSYPINFFEIFPVRNREYVFYTFRYINNRINPFKLKNIHKRHVKIWDKKRILKEKNLRKVVYGLVPLGIIKGNAADNIFFFGDTSLIGTPTITSGFTNIIQHYKKYAKHITKCIRSNLLDEKSLNYPYTELEKMNRDLLLIISILFLKSKPKEMDIITDAFGKLPNHVIKNLIFLRITPKQIYIFIHVLVNQIGFRGLVKILPREEYFFLAKEAARIIEDITMEEAERIFNVHHNLKS